VSQTSISRHSVEVIEALGHRLSTHRATKVDAADLCDIAGAELGEVAAELRATRHAEGARLAEAVQHLAAYRAALATVRERWRQDGDPDAILVDLLDETDEIEKKRVRGEVLSVREIITDRQRRATEHRTTT
jgi:hypothetical protein